MILISLLCVVYRCTFETAAVLLTLVSLGKLMEAIAKGQVMTLRKLIG